MAKKTAGTARKTKGLSVHIGLNAVSAKHYKGWSGELTACEFDAHDMAAIAKGGGHEADRAADKEGHAAKRRLAPSGRPAKTLDVRRLFCSSPTPATAVRSPTSPAKKTDNEGRDVVPLRRRS